MHEVVGIYPIFAINVSLLCVCVLFRPVFYVLFFLRRKISSGRLWFFCYTSAATCAGCPFPVDCFFMAQRGSSVHSVVLSHKLCFCVVYILSTVGLTPVFMGANNSYGFLRRCFVGRRDGAVSGRLGFLLFLAWWHACLCLIVYVLSLLWFVRTNKYR